MSQQPLLDKQDNVPCSTNVVYEDASSKTEMEGGATDNSGKVGLLQSPIEIVNAYKEALCSHPPLESFQEEELPHL